MSSTAWIVAGAIGVAVLLLAAQLVRLWLRLRGVRAVTCPETGRKAGVELDAGRAAVSAAFTGAQPRLSTCTRWPERQGCGQECLREVAATGPSCLVRSILTTWYAGKQCFYCGRPIGEIDWASRKPALLSPQGVSVEWAQLKVEQLDDVLATHRPVCFACHLTNTFVREHPDLVVDRSARV